MGVPTAARILIADDDDLVPRYLGQWLRQRGYDCESAGTGEEALEALESKPFDLLLLDLDMPGNDDLAIVRDRKGEAELVPVIILTGKATLESAVLALRLGVADYVTKPARLEDLEVRIEHTIRKGRAIRQLVEYTRSHAQSLTTAFHAQPSPLGAVAAAGASAAANKPLAAELTDLTERELEIVRMIAAGRRSPDVAQQLGLSPHTVRAHLKGAFRKLGVHSQVELVAKMNEFGLR